MNSGAGSSPYQSAPLRSERPSPIQGTESGSCATAEKNAAAASASAAVYFFISISSDLTANHYRLSALLRHCVLHAERKILGAGVVVIFKIDYSTLRDADGVEISVAGGEIGAVRAFRH